jgi:hypothetical protein
MNVSVLLAVIAVVLFLQLIAQVVRGSCLLDIRDLLRSHIESFDSTLQDIENHLSEIEDSQPLFSRIDAGHYSNR